MQIAIPDDILNCVFAHLENRDLLNAGKVNKQFNRVMRQVIPTSGAISWRSTAPPPNDTAHRNFRIGISNRHIPGTYATRMCCSDGVLDGKDFRQVRHLEFLCVRKLIFSEPMGPIESLCISFALTNFTDFHAIGQSQSLELEGCESLVDTSTWTQVKNLKMKLCDVHQLQGLKSVETLHLDKCRGLIDLTGINPKARSVNLRNMVELSDLRPLLNIRAVHLYKCENLTDVSPLRNADLLEIANCDQVADVSMLGTVRELRLIECPGVFDVSALGTVRILTLDNCVNVTNIRALGTVVNLSLIRFAHHDVSALGNVECLTIKLCAHVRDVRALGTVKHLTIEHSHIADVRALGTVKSLTLVNCLDVRNISRLATVPKLEIRGCRHIRNFSMLPPTQHLTLTDVDTKLPLSHFDRFKNVTLYGCFVSAYDMPDIPPWYRFYETVMEKHAEQEANKNRRRFEIGLIVCGFLLPFHAVYTIGIPTNQPPYYLIFAFCAFVSAIVACRDIMTR